jgi:hypothetical protein
LTVHDSEESGSLDRATNQPLAMSHVYETTNATGSGRNYQPVEEIANFGTRILSFRNSKTHTVHAIRLGHFRVAVS